MDNSNQCEVFVDGIAHPNEKVLAKEILEGKKVGEFSLNFDQAQMDAMLERLGGAGCINTAPAVEEAPAEEAKKDEDVKDEGGEETADTPTGTGQGEPDAPAVGEAGDATDEAPETPNTGAQTPAPTEGTGTSAEGTGAPQATQDVNPSGAEEGKDTA